MMRISSKRCCHRVLRLAAATTAVEATGGVRPLPRARTARDDAVETLSNDLFSRGNKHLKTIEEMSALPEGLHSFPEVCFVGKPNCGKSSIIGGLCHNPMMGRSGRQAGKTKKIEFFNIGDGLLLVDTPGYGAWRRRTTAEQVLGVTNTRRYISLRKNANLKRVYWVMECPALDGKHVTINPRYHQQQDASSRRPPSASMLFQARDEEMLEFLMHERVPFTVLLSKADRCLGHDWLLRQRVHEIYQFLRSDKVPVLDVTSRHAQPRAYKNLDVLMCDLVDACCTELGDDEISVKGLHSLSYLPPTAADIIAVEERYPFGAHLLPKLNNTPIDEMVEHHNAARLAFAQDAVARNRMSEKDLGHILSIGSEASPTSVLAAISQPREGRQNGQLSLPPSKALSTGPSDTREVSVTSSAAVGGRTFSGSDAAPSASSVMIGGGASMLSTNLRSASNNISSVVGVGIPHSMVPSSVAIAAKKLDRSAEAYAEMIERQGYGGVIQDPQEFFVARGQSARCALEDGEQFVSRRQQQRQAMRRKYVTGVRKDRSIQLDAQGFMCPWLGGASEGGRVRGVAEARSGGGTMVRHLKRVGFGGQSFSAKTMKNRFRATKKTGSWAT